MVPDERVVEGEPLERTGGLVLSAVIVKFLIISGKEA